MDLELSWHAILFIINRIFENGEFQGNYLKFLPVGKAIHYITDQNVREYIHKATRAVFFIGAREALVSNQFCH